MTHDTALRSAADHRYDTENTPYKDTAKKILAVDRADPSSLRGAPYRRGSAKGARWNVLAGIPAAPRATRADGMRRVESYSRSTMPNALRRLVRIVQTDANDRPNLAEKQ